MRPARPSQIAAIAATTIFNGAFADMLTGQMPIILFKLKRVVYWGSADQRMDFTTVADTAAYAEPYAAIKDELGFREDSRGANLWLVVPNDAGVFQGADERGGLRCVHPVQAYLDLKEHPERSSEAADRLRAEFLDRQAPWAHRFAATAGSSSSRGSTGRPSPARPRARPPLRAQRDRGQDEPRSRARPALGGDRSGALR